MGTAGAASARGDRTEADGWLATLAATRFAARSERAIWLQIYDRLKRSIESQELASGAQLPGEHQIAAAFDVNRLTLRRALSRLQSEGYLSARKGVGVFVRQTPTQYTVASNQGFLANVDGDLDRFAVRTLSLSRSPASAEIAGVLGVGEGDEIIRLERVRLRDGHPLYHTVKCFPGRPFPGFEAAYAGRSSVSDAFAAHGVGQYERAQTVVTGGFARSDEAAALGLTPKTPVLRTRATVVTPEGRAIEFSLGCWPLTMVELVFD